MDGSDYTYRVWIGRQQVAVAMKTQVEGINYPNVKNTITNPAHHEAA